MKKLASVWLAAVCLLGVCACGQQAEVLHLGLNGEIVEVDAENCILYVKDADEEAAVFGDRCAVSCEKAVEAGNVIYVDYSGTHEVRDIAFDELQVGDDIILGLYDRELENAKQGAASAEQIQLSTQRLNETPASQAGEGG